MGLQEELGRVSTATLGEVQNGRGIIDAPLRPLAVPCHVAGPAFPVTLPAGDNLSVHHAIARAAAGSVLVVSCGDDRHGFWGEIATVAAMARSITGLVTNGAVRDTDRIRELGFPVFSGAIHIRGTVKQKRGTVGMPIGMGGVNIRLGDYIVGDSDGLVVVKPDELEATLRAAQQRDEKEHRIMEALRAGKTTIELFDLPGE